MTDVANNTSGASAADEASPRKKKPRGFAALDPARQREIASMGGRAAHQSGHAHEFNSAEARVAGQLRHAKERQARQAQG
jgi:hypothetical protein